MKKTLLLILLFAGITVQAQNVIAGIPSMRSVKSIVREYDKNSFLLYNDDGANNNSFNLIDLNVGTCHTMYVAGLDVSDMEIVGQTAYFCGKWNGRFVAGWFGITSLFFSGGSISYIGLPSLFPCALDGIGIDELLSLRKLEVIDYGSSYNHLVMVGDAGCLGDTTHMTCFMEIYYRAGSWRFAYQVEHDGIFHYDDIAVTSSDVVLVGHKTDSEGEYLTSFTIPAINTGIVFSSSYLTYGSWGPMYNPHRTSELLVENIPGTNRFATVCQAQYCTGPNACNDATFINIYNGAGTLLYKGMINDYHDLTYRELKYNPNKNSFFLLMKDCSTNMHNGYYEFALDNTMSYVTDVYFHQDHNANEYVSLDRYTKESKDRQCVLSGYDSGSELMIWCHDNLLQKDCSKTFDVPIYYITPYHSYFYYEYSKRTAKVTVNLYNDSITISELEVICNEN